MAAPALKGTRGDTLTWTFTVTGDLTGWTPRIAFKTWQDWAGAADVDADLVVTTGSGLVVTPGTPSSTVVMTVAAATMAALDPDVYVWDLQLSSGSEVRTVEWDDEGTTVGTLTIAPDVTRTTP